MKTTLEQSEEFRYKSETEIEADHTIKIKKRLDEIVKNKETRELMRNDYAWVFNQLGLDSDSANNIAEQCIGFIENSSTMQEAEDKIRLLFRETRVEDKDLFALISMGLEDRVDKIVNQLQPHIADIKGKVFDYGMGAGEITQILHDKFGLDIEGGDVRDFRSKHVSVPFVRLNSNLGEDGRIVPIEDGHYEAAILTNVIHHEAINENILKELNRIVAHKLVIIETVPVGNTPEELALDHERTFSGDVLWNRFLNYADIPVPGTYETPDDWIKRFEKYGWKTMHSEDLGIDQKTIRDVHHLLVFER